MIVNALLSASTLREREREKERERERRKKEREREREKERERERERRKEREREKERKNGAEDPLARKCSPPLFICNFIKKPVINYRLFFVYRSKKRKYYGNRHGYSSSKQQKYSTLKTKHRRGQTRGETGFIIQEEQELK